MEVLYIALVVAGLLALNGVFVAAEFALVSVPKSAVQRAAADGSRLARRLLVVLEDPRQQDLYIAATQLGVTFASLGLGMYGEHAMAHQLAIWFEDLGLVEYRWFAAHAVASVVALVLLTVLHVVVGEMVPKTLALGRPRAAAWFTLPFALSSRFVFYPLVRALEFSSNRILKLLGVDRAAGHAGQHHTEEDLQHIVQQSREMGKLRTEAGKVVADLLEFGNLCAEDVMVPRVNMRGVELGTEPAAIRELLKERQHTRFPVYEDSLDNTLGMVHIKDLLRLLREDRPLTRARVRPIAFVPESMNVHRVMQVMRRDRTHMVVVMDEQGGTAGILTVKDFFEEVVGNIDEDVAGGGEHHDAWRDEHGHLRVAGTLRLDELAEELESELPEADVETVSGLVLLQLGRPARVGDEVEFGEARLLVVGVEGRGVKECMVLTGPITSMPTPTAATSHETAQTKKAKDMEPKPEDLLALLDPIAEVLAELPLDDEAMAQAALTKHFPPDGGEVAAIRQMLAAAENTDWLLTKEAGGVRFGRIAKDHRGFSIDVVLSGGPGPKHRHPKGEVDLIFDWSGSPTFDGHGEGWAVYAPGSEHVPAVSDGRMMIVYFLPGGAIGWC